VRTRPEAERQGSRKFRWSLHLSSRGRSPPGFYVWLGPLTQVMALRSADKAPDHFPQGLKPTDKSMPNVGAKAPTPYLKEFVRKPLSRAAAGSNPARGRQGTA